MIVTIRLFCGGAVVSGSFQGFDQDYLVAALKELGPSYVGVTQLPFSVSAEEILRLHRGGVRAIRFNFKRGVRKAKNIWNILQGECMNLSDGILNFTLIPGNCLNLYQIS